MTQLKASAKTQLSGGSQSNESADAKRIAYYGGSFDPPHNGHLAVATAIVRQFSLTQLMFVPAYHAPHKPDLFPVSAFHRFAMLALATDDKPQLGVSPLEVELPERPFTFETLERLLNKADARNIYFVMGADSWNEIDTWRNWGKLLAMTNHIVVTRPGFDIRFDHLNDEVRHRIIDLRGAADAPLKTGDHPNIYLSDVVNAAFSARDIRRLIKNRDDGWQAHVPKRVANYIEKYELYT